MCICSRTVRRSCKGLAKVGDRVGIKFNVTNYQGVNEQYAVIIQIKNAEGITVQLSWLTFKSHPEQSMEVIQSWVPESTSMYTAEIFIWKSVDAPTALSPMRTLQIDVNC
jgi:hypothetical protein